MNHNPETRQGGGMSRAELRAALSLSGVYSLRMLGLFLILPVFTLYAHDLQGYTPAMAGLAIGVYGLTQAMLQIPFGMLSDRIGRKPVMVAGLIIFALGSVVAASAETIQMIIFGRALQGSGAIAAVVMATAADLSREQRRLRMMAIIGMSIGAAFAIFAGVYFWIGKMSGRQYPEFWGKVHFWMFFIGVNVTFFPQHFLGRQGMPRRYIDYPEAYAYWNYVSSIGAFIAFASFVLFIGIVFYTLTRGARITEKNYWNEHADTLEWTLPTPPPEHTFETLPKREDWDKAPAH